LCVTRDLVKGRGASRTDAIARSPLTIIAVTYIAFGIVAFGWCGSHHALGFVLVGVLILGAVAIRFEKK
jgi:hypothetical protein